MSEIEPLCAEFACEILRLVRETDVMSIVDFGGIHTAYFNESYTKCVKEELQYFKNVLLLMPSENKEKSFKHFASLNLFPNNLRYDKIIYDAPSYKELATKIFYFEDLTEDESYEQINSYLKAMYDLKRAEIPTLNEALLIRRKANKYFPGAYNID